MTRRFGLLALACPIADTERSVQSPEEKIEAAGLV
jgi:hypothetical protein